MSRNYDHSVLKQLTRYAPETDADIDDLEDEYDLRSKQTPMHYPRGRHTEEPKEDIE